MIDKMDTLYDKIIAAVNEESNYIDVREVALTAYDRKMFDVAEIFAEKALSINSMDKSLLILIAELALKKKDYTLALHYLSECKKYHKLETKELHNYFKCMEQCEKPIDDEDVEVISQLYAEDTLNASERYLLLNYNKDKNDTKVWEMYFNSKENAGKTDVRNAYKNARIYADERWEMYLTFRVEYSVEHHAWLSRVVVRSLLDNASNEVMVADNADATMLVSKLKIKNVKDTLYKTNNGTAVCLEQKIRVRELNPESEETDALS